jgi:hypothetical protein
LNLPSFFFTNIFGLRRGMHIKTSVAPNLQQITGFFEPGPEGPIYKVNLLKFKDNAEYENTHPTKLTGRKACGIYGAAVFATDVDRLMCGEVEALWDEAAIAIHPLMKSMLDMMQSPTMLEMSTHRAAGLAAQLNREPTAPKRAWLDKA